MNSNIMKMKWFAILFLTIYTLNFASTDQLEEISTHIQLLEMDLEDYCDAVADSQKLIKYNVTNARQKQIDFEIEYGTFMKTESDDLRTNFNIQDVMASPDLDRIWEIFSKMGDIVLPGESWNELVKFKNKNEELSDHSQISCFHETENCTLSRKDINHILATSRNATELQKVWSATQSLYLSNSNQYKNIVNLISKSSEANGLQVPHEYWEMLLEYPNAYSIAKSLWSEIEPFYVKFHTFVKSRLEQYYNGLGNSTSIPVYLLGTETGADWSKIAPLVLPHRYLYDEITSMLDHEKIGGRKAYEIAEKFTTSMNLRLGTAGEKFWKYSSFNNTCPSKILTYCSQKYPIVVTCNSTGWSEYLDAHEDMMRMTINNLNYTGTTLSAFRISALDEAIISLSSILAIKNLPLVGIVPEDVFEDDADDNQMTALFLTALRVLPRLPYYLLADLWRIDQLEKESENLIESWWTQREAVQRVKGFTNTEWDFLGDPYMISNKPYIGKFLGTIIQFQVLQYFQQEEHNVNILTRIGNDENFRTLLKQRSREDWPTVLSENLYYYDITTEALLEYFRPLEEYMKSAPTKQVTQTVRPKTTTPLPKPTTQSTSTTTQIRHKPAPVVEKARNNKMDILSQDQPQGSVPAKQPKVVDTRVKMKEAPKPAERDEPVMSSTAAAWLGAGIGVGTLIIIGVIVGRRKFSRRPATNNRRFHA